MDTAPECSGIHAAEIGYGLGRQIRSAGLIDVKGDRDSDYLRGAAEIAPTDLEQLLDPVVPIDLMMGLTIVERSRRIRYCHHSCSTSMLRLVARTAIRTSEAPAANRGFCYPGAELMVKWSLTYGSRVNFKLSVRA
jgi:hypothetical protein